MPKYLSKRVLIILLLIIISVIIWVFIKNRFGDIRPAILPPKNTLTKISEQQETGEKVDFPLKIAAGFKIGIFAKDLGAARDLQFSPGGVLMVSSPSRGKVYALTDKNNDGKADKLVTVLNGLDEPHGLAFYRGKLFVAELTKVGRYFWDEKNLAAKRDKILFSLPYNGGHHTRSLAISSYGQLFVSIGSSCNVCIEASQWLASIVVSDSEGKNPRFFAKGLRNSVFIIINPKTGQLWGTEMGRDHLGDNLPPEEINIIESGKDYGWPFCYGNKTYDLKFPHPHMGGECASTQAPIYEFQAHSAPLGLTFIDSSQFPDEWQGDLLVAYHGSWNRSVPTGYKVVRMDVNGNKIAKDEDFITGFLDGSQTLGRPVDLEFSKDGSLFISDDKLGVVYRVVKK